MEDRSPQHLSQDDIRKKLAALREQPAAPPRQEAPPPPAGWERYLQAAAVLAYYDPTTLQPLPSPDGINDTPDVRNRCLNFVIGYSEMATDSRQYEKKEKERVNYKIVFILRDDVRKETLRMLIREKKLVRALEVNAKRQSATGLVLQDVLERCLTGRTKGPKELSLEEMHALSKVLDWLPDIPELKRIPSPHDVRRMIETGEMLTPLKHLTGRYVDGRWESLFRGRQAELATLRKYVGVAPPRGILESVERFVAAGRDFLFTTSKKPLLVFGIGGIGKSTLLAEFILEHAEAHRADRFPFVYLDFDRPQLNALEPETLLIEAARQIAIQYQDIPAICEQFNSFYKKWNEVATTWLDSGSSQTIILRDANASQQKEHDRKEMQSTFLDLARRLGELEPRPFVMVMDTFEEVQYKGVEYVKQLYDFITRLRDEHSLVRVIVAGRAPVSELETLRLELSSLDNEAASGYLIRLGIANPADAGRIASLIGGNPLTLRLAAEIAGEWGSAALRDLKLSHRGGFLNISSKRLSELQIQGVLYRRILNHIHLPEVKKLAYPGMVLRRITADIILHVLAEPCGLMVSTPEQAEQLFQDMKREVSLVVPSESGVLRHRPDVRKVMLKLIQGSDQKKVAEEIHNAALKYYMGKEGVENRAEEFYHALSMDISPRLIDNRWIDGMQNYLLGSLDELPPRAQAYLLSRSGRESTDLSIWEKADMEDRNRSVARRATDLLNSGYAEGALRVLDEGVYEKGSEVLSMLKVRALYQLQRVEEAKALAQQTLESYYVDEFDPAVTRELQRFANPDAGNIDPMDFDDDGSGGGPGGGPDDGPGGGASGGSGSGSDGRSSLDEAAFNSFSI